MISKLAAGQHGVIARWQLLAAGISDDAIAHRVAVRRLHRLHGGVVAISERPSELGRLLAAVLACGERAVLSHRSAGALWDLLRDRGPIDVLVVGRVRAKRGLRVRSTRSLHPADVTAHRGIACTSVARTIVDLGAVLRPHELNKVLERSMVLSVFDKRALDAALARANGRRGTGYLRRLLEDMTEPPPTRSELERRFLELLRVASLPSPITNGLVGGYEVDFHWPEAKLIVETDGRATHDNPFAFERDHQRDLELKLAGWEVIRITWRQLREEPDRVTTLLRAHLGCL